MKRKTVKPKPKAGAIVSLDGMMQLRVEAVKGKLLLCKSVEHGIPMTIERDRVEIVTPAA